MLDDERALLRQAVAGNRDALSALLSRNAAAVRASLTGQMPAKWRSLLSEDDVLQQTYADAFCDIQYFDPEGDGTFSGWLCKLAQWNLRDGIRMLSAAKRGGGRSRVELGDPQSTAMALVEALTSTGTSPSAGAAGREAATLLEQALAKVPSTYRLVVRLYDLEGHSADSIAAQLGRSPGAVYMLRARAHDQLRRRLGETGNFFTDCP